MQRLEFFSLNYIDVRCVSKNWSVFDSEAFEAELAKLELYSAQCWEVFKYLNT